MVHGYDIGLPSNVYVHHVPLGTASIAEGIDDELTSFHATLIQAPTGFGKTHFILHEVLPRVLQEGGRMLLVSNRVAVSYQQKREVMELTNPSEIRCLTPEGILQKTDFGPVKIMTLQALDMFLASPEGKDYAKEVSVLVVDEVHYFTSDVSFNPNAARLLKVLPQLFCQAVRIYMTATPDDVLRPLAEAEAKVRRPLAERMGIQFSPLMLGQAPGVNLYRFSSDKYSRLPVRYYRTDNELYPEIRNHDQDKWLIFVPTKELGVSMQKELGDDAVFISAQSKGSPQWNQLLSEKRSSSRVLIATSVLDCGVNLCDDSIRHVVVPFEDPTTFMQALGRVRFKNTPFNESKQQEFGQELAACYSAIFGKKKRIDRNNGKYGLVQLNHMLDELGVCGKIDKIGKKGSEAWILQIAHDACLRSETGGGCGKQDDHSGGESPIHIK